VASEIGCSLRDVEELEWSEILEWQAEFYCRARDEEEAAREASLRAKASANRRRI